MGRTGTVVLGVAGTGVLMGRTGNVVLEVVYRIGTGVLMGGEGNVVLGVAGTGVLMGRTGNVVLEIVYRIGTGGVVLLSGRCLQSFLSAEPSTENFPVGHGLHLVEAVSMEYVSIGQSSHFCWVVISENVPGKQARHCCAWISVTMLIRHDATKRLQTHTLPLTGL
jgi:hypothetical protein